MQRSRHAVEAALDDGQAHYGINTGFGSLSQRRISRTDLAKLQVNLVRSHAAGVGPPLPPDTVRAMMMLLAASLCRGLSGVRPVVAQTVVDLLNHDIVPLVPSLGSVGASGDLAPLAHVALAAIGEGEAFFRGRQVSAADALRKARIAPLRLGAKEGLALINGTHLMAASGALLCLDARHLITTALGALAMSIDACRASHSFLDARLAHARAQSGFGPLHAQLRALLLGSQIAESHRENDPRVQDPYSLRAAPTVLGACVQALVSVESRIADELGAVTDNPLVFLPDIESTPPTAAILSGANFHGLPLALPLDFLGIALCHVAAIAERRTYLLTGAFEPESHLKPFLAPRPGLQSGLMIAQYTAAACVNEAAGLSTPASVTNVPTSAGMEDYNSFGPRAAAKARRILELARYVVATELICAAQGLEHHRPLKSGPGVERLYQAVRRVVPRLSTDRPPGPDIERLAARMAEGPL